MKYFILTMWVFMCFIKKIDELISLYDCNEGEKKFIII